MGDRVREGVQALKDPELVARCLARQRGAWELLVDRYADLIYGIARRSGLDGPAGEDVVQDVLLALLKNLKRLRNRNRLMGWIVRTTRRESWRAMRRARSVREREDAKRRPDQDIAPLPVQALEAEERRHMVRQALAALSTKCQRLLDALFLRDAGDYQDLSAELGMPVGSIGPTRKRCLEKMAGQLAALGFPMPDVSTSAPDASSPMSDPPHAGRRAAGGSTSA